MVLKYVTLMDMTTHTFKKLFEWSLKIFKVKLPFKV
jgi:hypothetical protein